MNILKLLVEIFEFSEENAIYLFKKKDRNPGSPKEIKVLKVNYEEQEIDEILKKLCNSLVLTKGKSGN